MEAPKAPSAWFGENDINELEEFDQHFSARRPPSWSRSDEIKRAMRLHRVVDEVLASRDVDPADMRERETMVRQALYDYLRED